MGRPPGALSGNRRRYPRDWELREPARFAERLQEIHSDEDPQGVNLNSTNRAFWDPRQSSFVPDPLYFEGYDLGQAKPTRWDLYEGAGGGYDDDGSDNELDEDLRAVAHTDDVLIRSALERVSRARAKGKTNVNLTEDEMEALERRRNLQPEPSTALASPPPTPAKKGKAGSRQSSSTNLAAQKTRKKASPSLFGSSPAKSNSKAKVTRTASAERARIPAYPPAGVPPGMMIPGPNGVPLYAPFYYPPSSPESTRPRAAARPRARSTSKHSQRDISPPDPAYQGYSSRYYPTPPGVRPDSSSSTRSFADENDWYPPPGRNRSASNAHYAAYRPSDDFDGAPSMPAAQGRRNVSGPPDVRYSTLRRVPPSSSPLAARPSANRADSDPSSRDSTHLRRVGTSDSSSGGDDQGVQVDIVPNENGGYSIRSAPAPTAAPAKSGSNGTESRKRKSGRK